MYMLTRRRQSLLALFCACIASIATSQPEFEASTEVTYSETIEFNEDMLLLELEGLITPSEDAEGLFYSAMLYMDLDLESYSPDSHLLQIHLLDSPFEGEILELSELNALTSYGLVRGSIGDTPSAHVVQVNLDYVTLNEPFYLVIVGEEGMDFSGEITLKANAFYDFDDVEEGESISITMEVN